jgi:hypothetical protein
MGQIFPLIGKDITKDCTENAPWGKRRNLRGGDRGREGVQGIEEV